MFHLNRFGSFLFFSFLGTGTSREQQQKRQIAAAAAAAGNGANSDVDGVFNPSASSSTSYVLHQRHWKGKQQQVLPVAAAANLLLNSEDVKAEGDDDEYDDDSDEEEEEDYLADESSSSLNGFRWPPESYFDLEASSDVTVVVGQAAFLVCRVAIAGNWTVSTLFVCLL